jgi:hypothetical protein
VRQNCHAKWEDFSRNLTAEARHCAFHFGAKLVNACAALLKKWHKSKCTHAVIHPCFVQLANETAEVMTMTMKAQEKIVCHNNGGTHTPQTRLFQAAYNLDRTQATIDPETGLPKPLDPTKRRKHEKSNVDDVAFFGVYGAVVEALSVVGNKLVLLLQYAEALVTGLGSRARAVLVFTLRQGAGLDFFTRGHAEGVFEKFPANYWVDKNGMRRTRLAAWFWFKSLLGCEDCGDLMLRWCLIDCTNFVNQAEWGIHVVSDGFHLSK